MAVGRGRLAEPLFLVFRLDELYFHDKTRTSIAKVNVLAAVLALRHLLLQWLCATLYVLVLDTFCLQISYGGDLASGSMASGCEESLASFVAGLERGAGFCEDRGRASA